MFLKTPIPASASPVFDEKHLEASLPSSPVRTPNPVVSSAQFVLEVLFFFSFFAGQLN